jgi:excisionase family DNA binding protein
MLTTHRHQGGWAASKASDTMVMRNDTFTIKELSEHLRIHPTTIYRLLRVGRLPGFRVGSNWRFTRTVIQGWERAETAGLQVVSRRGRWRRS